MNKIVKMLCAACALAMLSFGVAKADSSNFAGPYVGASVSGYGIQLSGSADLGTDEGVTDVSLGQVAPVTGLEVGYVLPVGSAFLIDIGATYYSGAAKLDFANDAGNTASAATNTLGAKKVSFTIDDLVTAYIAPTLALSDTSSLYVKVGVSEADVQVSGDLTAPANLSGTTWAVGTRTVLDSGIFIRTEAGYTDYNGIGAAGKGTSISTLNKYSADPTVAFGAVSLGFRF
jgi:hypothetical protein